MSLLPLCRRATSSVSAVSSLRAPLAHRTAASTAQPSGGKREGTIADAFASLSGQSFKPLDPRFAALKASLIQGNEAAVQASWVRLLKALQQETRIVAAAGSSIVPEINFEDIKSPSTTFLSEYKKRGVAVVRNTIPEKEALQMKEDLRAYLRNNPQTKAFPESNPQVFELYWSPAQIKARGHPNLLAAQQWLLSFWHSTNPDAPVSSQPIAYADRLRMRQPGDAQFALGPHVDGGSCERWEREGYGRGSVYDKIFAGDWESFDSWEASCRLPAVSDLYQGVGACSAFRMSQGWLSISEVGPYEGTLLVNPMLQLATAYFLLRPFFRSKLEQPQLAWAGKDIQYSEEFLAPENWVLETDAGRQMSSWLQGATPGHGQELRHELHPHLSLPNTMVHVPRVRPGDYVVWHCDTIHAVDSVHKGMQDSSVMYIPACPLTEENARYLVRQRDCFLGGVPSPDFPGGVGESQHVGRQGPIDVSAAGGKEAMRAMGLEAFDMSKAGLTSGERKVLKRANEILGFV